MSKIFLISGLGADTRLYNNIDISPAHDVIPVDWIEPNKTDTLSNFAQKLIYQYNITNNSIVIGTSLGGMIAIEIAKQISLKKTIIISSIKTVNEAPGYFSLFRNVPVYKLFSGKALASLGFLMKPVFGNITGNDAWLFKDMLYKSSPEFIKWALGAVLKWNNTVIPPNVYHIHGDNDMVLPHKKIKNATIVKDGTHIMIYDKAKQINKWLKPLLKK